MRKLILKKKSTEEAPKKTKFKIPHEENEEEFELGDINKYKLDEEAEKNDKLYREVSKIYARKVRIKYESELDVAITKDDIAEEIRENPIKWGLKKDEKITESLISRIIVRDERYLEKYHIYIKAKSQEKEWEGIKESLDQRGWQIKLLYEMWAQAYYK